MNSTNINSSTKSFLNEANTSVGSGDTLTHQKFDDSDKIRGRELTGETAFSALPLYTYKQQNYTLSGTATFAVYRFSYGDIRYFQKLLQVFNQVRLIHVHRDRNLILRE